MLSRHRRPCAFGLATAAREAAVMRLAMAELSQLELQLVQSPWRGR